VPEQLVFLATAWGTRHGGVNTFNSELCVSLAEVLPVSYEIVCVVLRASATEVAEAATARVTLIGLSAPDDEATFTRLRGYDVVQATLKDDGEVLWWIGHDAFTGEIAFEARKIAGLGKVAIFHHMIYFSYTGIKHQDGGLALSRTNAQQNILRKADLVFAIGPRLARNATALRPAGVHEILPGLADIRGQPLPPTFRVVTFGRLGNSDDLIKQGRLAVAAFARALAENAEVFGSDPSFVLIGVPPDEVQQSQELCSQLATKYAKRIVNVLVIPYLEDRSLVLTTLASSTICLMLSLHEGFGLVGWEAIAAEVPLIVSRNSGLFDYIEATLGGVGTGCLIPVNIKGSLQPDVFSEADLIEVAHALSHAALKREALKQDAKRLKELLRARHTWKNTALAFAAACELQIMYLGGGEEYLTELVRTAQFEEVVHLRSDHFRQVWNQIDDRAKEQKKLILFGGISSALCSEKAAVRYATWLIRNPAARLFVCYESGEAALRRAALLDASRLSGASGLPTTPNERMLEKEKLVLELRSRLAETLSVSVLTRAHFVPLTSAITNYIIVTDLDIFFSPVFQRRSSETMSIRLQRDHSPFRRQVIDYMLYQLASLQQSDAVTFLVQDLRTLQEGS
jgi:glycosyltransferase involved in cell wall biosynthesis